MWRVLRARERSRGRVVPAPRRAGVGRRDHHRRGPRARRRPQPASTGVRRGGRDAVRLLHERDAHLRDGVAARGPATDGRGDPRCARAQPVPLWRVHARDTRHQARGRGGGGGIRSGDRTEPYVTWGEREPERVEERIRIEPDGTVVALSGKIEFGQGIRTAFAQLVADELDVPIEKVRVVLGDTDHVPHDMGTFGSRSVAQESPVLRRAAAFARTQLIARASETLRVPRERLSTVDGFVCDGGMRVAYADLVRQRPLSGRIPDDVPARDPSNRRY